MTKKRTMKSILVSLLTLALLLSVFAGFGALEIHASNEIHYVAHSWNGNTSTLSSETRTVTD